MTLPLWTGCGDDGGDDTMVDAGGNPDAAAMVDAGEEADASTEPILEEMFQAAVADAEQADADEVVDTLTAINDENMDLQRDEEGRVLMVTWTSYAGYDDLVGEETELGVEVWTTVAPQMKEFCQALGTQDDVLSLRLEQLLGLPPNNGKDRVVELWVEPSAMFRPSPDPEITDSVAELDFPEGTDQMHIDWVESLEASSYGTGGYPWTRLGYTYDWNPDTSEVGLSEFVVTQGTTVGVESVTPTNEYCQE